MKAPLAALVMTTFLASPLALGASKIALAGYETINSFASEVLEKNGFEVESFTNTGLPVEDYGNFEAVLWNEQIADPGSLQTNVAWDTAEPVSEVAKYVKNGGRVVITGVGIPVTGGQVRNLDAAADLVGITGVAKAKVQPEVTITEPGDPIFKGIEIPAAGFLWGGDYARVARGVTTGKVLATARTDAGEELPFITVREMGKGRVYWFGAVPKRMQQIGVDPKARAAYETVLARALGYEGKALAASDAPPEGLNGWGLVPLGEDLEMPPGAFLKTRKVVPPERLIKEEGGEPIPVVKDGLPAAVIVTANTPSPAVREAAELLRSMIQSSTGADLPIRTESAVLFADDGTVSLPARPEIVSAIVVGPTEVGRKIGLKPEDFPEEGFLIEPKANALHVVGRDQSARGVETFGTKFGAITLLEREMGVRWLWPGKEGLVLPKTKDFVVSRTRIHDSPALPIRKLRNLGASGAAYHNENLLEAREAAQKIPERASLTGFPRRLAEGIELLGIPYKNFALKHSGGLDWFETARLGASLRVNAGHAFHGWYEKYHKDHPDWFALQPDGTRNQVPVRETFSTYNEGFRDAAAKQIIKAMDADPTLAGGSASLNDGGQNAFCMDEASRRQDPPDGPKISFRYELKGKDYAAPYVSMTDRILNYYNAVTQRVVEKKPDALVGAQAYSYYRLPPMQTPVHPSLVISFVGLSYLDHARHFTDKASWDKWSSLANRLILRPNTLHTGHGFPAVFISRLGKDLKHCYETGMIGADFDSISHHWATQGLNYYVLARLLWDPSANPDEILDDYCRAGFGKGAEPMKKYFVRVEEITEKVGSNVKEAVEAALRDEEELNTARFALATQTKELNKAYNPEVERELRSLLAEASEAAKGDEGSLARIRFVGRGLDYVSAQRTFYAAVDRGEGASALESRNAVFRDLFENDYFAVNLPVILWRETALLSGLGVKAQPR